MFVAVQLAILAACVVLFVCMGMAVRRLIRGNKVLFFSLALFITLALAFQLIPYLPSVMVSPLPSLIESISSDPTSCISLLHEVLFFSRNSRKDFGGFWRWEDNRTVVRDCGFSMVGRMEASELLNGSWVVVAGDSQARLFVDSLLNLVLRYEKMELVKGDLFNRQGDYNIVVPEIGLKLDFIWAPYIKNLTDMIGLWSDKMVPNVLVLGVGVWDLLNVSSSLDYGVSLGLLRDSLIPVSTEFGTNDHVLGSVSPHLFWLGMPSLPSLVNTISYIEEKREKMTLYDAYEKELFKSKLLRQNGGPIMLLDIRSLSEKCGAQAQCTMDEMQFGGAVYESSVQIMLNALLIESHQKLRCRLRFFCWDV